MLMLIENTICVQHMFISIAVLCGKVSFLATVETPKFDIITSQIIFSWPCYTGPIVSNTTEKYFRNTRKIFKSNAVFNIQTHFVPKIFLFVQL